MIFKVQNLGYIEEAEVDLSKDLIVLTGQNNTGKTYLAYAIYGLFNTEFTFTLSDDDFELDDNSIRFNYKRIYEKYEREITEDMQKRINYLFASQQYFEKSKSIISLSKSDTDKLDLSGSIVHFGSHTKEEILSHIKEYEILKIIKQKLFPKTYIAPTERNAINIFSKELSLAKSRVLKNGKNDNTRFLNRYPMPIQDNLEISEDLAYLSRHKSEFEYLAIELEQEFLKGKITTNQYGQIEYQPDNQKDISLEIHLTASMVKSLSNIVFYLRHLAQKGDCIIIDEPELNLHPDNQRKIARFIGRLINEGFQVVISTHSDYIVKELNNMIMLSKAKENNQDLIEKLGFRGDELLKPEQVQALLFTLDSRKPMDIEITEEGFNVTTIDETIAKQDALTEEIYYQLFEQEAV